MKKIETKLATRRKLAALVKRNVQKDFGRGPLFALLSHRVIEAVVDAHVLRVVETWRGDDLTAERIAALRNDARQVVMFDL